MTENGNEQLEAEVERLMSRLDRAGDNWKERLEADDELGAAYELGKKSAFITAIEELNGWSTDPGDDQ